MLVGYSGLSGLASVFQRQVGLTLHQVERVGAERLLIWIEQRVAREVSP
jgi:hypothetical protein